MKRFSFSQWFESLRSRSKTTRRRHAMRGQFVEALEDRMLLTASPVTTVDMNLDVAGDQTGHQVLIGEDTRFSVTFDNLAGSDIGYGPFVDVVLDYSGTDGIPTPFPSSYFSPGGHPAFVAPFTGNPDGLGVDTTGGSAGAIDQLVTATTYGLPLDLFFTQFDANGHATHPFAKDANAVPRVVSGTPGDVLVSAQLPFGSFAHDQPPAPVVFTAHVSSLADMGVALTVQARGGFEFGATPTEDILSFPDVPLVEPPLSGLNADDSATWNSGSVTPQVLVFAKKYLAPENETATGINFPHQVVIAVNIAANQTITDLHLIDLLPNNVVFVSLDSVSPLSGIPSLPPLGVPSNNGVLNVPFVSVTGVAGNFAEAVVTFSFYVPEFNASSAVILNPATGASVTSPNNAQVTGDWVPVDTRDQTNGLGNPIHLVLDPPGPEAVLSDKSIAIQKYVSINGGPQTLTSPTEPVAVVPGDTIDYFLKFQVSDFFAFEDLVVDDYFSDGQLLSPTFAPLLTVSPNQNGVSLPVAFTSSVNVFDTFNSGTNLGQNDGNPLTHNSHHLQFLVSSLMISSGIDLNGQLYGGFFNGPSTGVAQGVIHFRTVVQDAYQEFQAGVDPFLNEHDELFNRVTITGEFLDTDGTGTGATQTDDSNAYFQVPVGDFTKTIYAFKGSTTLPPQPLHVAPDDTVTYHLHYDLTTGDYENFTLTDFLPAPFFLATAMTQDLTSTLSPPPLTATFVATLDGVTVPMIASPTPASNSVTWNFGTHSDLGNAATHNLDIYFTVTATHIPMADGLFLTNQGVSEHQDTHTHPIFATDLVQVVTSEPNLLITKGVVATDNDDPGHGVFTPALPNSSFTDPGTAGFRYTGGSITSTNLPSLIGSNLSDVDASDLVTFAIAVENIGSYQQGAFDVTVQDTIPAGFHIPAGGLNLTVTDGTGTLLAWTGALFGAGLELTDPNSTTGALDNGNPSIPGKNILFITYDLQADTPQQSPVGPIGVEACEVLTNTATLLAYTSLDGGAAIPGLNFVPDHLTDIATVAIACPTLTKGLVGSSIVNGNNDANEAVIGEIVSYVIHLTVPEGVSPNVFLVESPPPGMAILNVIFVGQLPTGVTTAGGVTLVSNTPISGGSSGSISLGTITNTDTNNNQAETLTFFVNAVVLNVPGNQDGTQLVNQAAFSVDGDLHPSVSAAPVTVIEPSLQVNKSVDLSSGVDAGDTVTFTIAVSNISPSSTDAYDAVVNDVIPAGFTYAANSLTFSGTAPAPSTSGVVGGVLSANWTSIPLNTTSILTFQVTLDHSLVPCQELTNTADVTWTSLPGPHGLIVGGNPDSTERDGTGGLKPYNDYFTFDTATVMVDCPELEKSIVATSEASTTGNNVAIGEIVRYRLLAILPEGTSPNFTMIDMLPSGMQFLDDGTAKAALVSDAGFTSGLIGANASLMLAPLTYVMLDGAISANASSNVDTYGDGTDVYFKLGSLVNNDNDNDPEFVVVEFNALVLNTLVNQAGVPLENCFSVTIQPCEDFELGVEDNYSPLINVETTAPHVNLLQHLTNLGVLPGNVKGYDDTTPNTFFAESFTGLPGGIISAQLRIALKPHAGISINDSLTVGVYDFSGTPLPGTSFQTGAFGAFIGSDLGLGRTSPPSLLSPEWLSTNYPNGTVLTLELGNLPNATSLIGAINAANRLDIFTQDDTAIDYIELCVTRSTLISTAMQVGGESNCVTVVVVEPELINIGKEYVSQTAPDGTFSVNYEVSFSNANGPFSSTAFDIHIDDPLSPFFILDTSNLIVKRNGLYTLVNGVDMDNISTSNHVNLTIHQLAPGDTIQLFYTVFVTSAIQPCQHITNIANVTYTSLPDSHGTKPNPTGSSTPGAPGSETGERDGSGAPLNDYFDMSIATITAACPEISKTIFATSNPLTGTGQFNPVRPDLAVGELVTYQVTFTLPVGTTSPAILTDNLPTGLAGLIQYVSSTIVSIGSSISSGPLVVPVVSDTDADLINDQVVYHFGTRTVVAGALATRQITVQVVGQVVNSVLNPLGKVLTNTASLYYGLGTMAAIAGADVVKPIVNNTPTDVVLSSTSIPEGNVINALLGVLSATDTDIGDTFTYMLVAGVGSTDNGSFVISGSNLMIIPRTDFETQSSYSIRVQVADQEALTFEKVFTITVLNVNESPTISGIANQSILEDSATASLPFTVGDPETPAGFLILSATSSNTGLIPNANIVFSGTGANRSLVITPAANQNGSAMITVTVSDGSLSSSQMFQVIVQAVADPAFIGLNPLPLVRRPARTVAAIDGAATFSNPDMATLILNGAVLKVSGQSSKDTLSIMNLNGITVKGTKLMSGNLVIGTLAGGKKGMPLIVTLNGSATLSSVQSLLRSIGFKSTDRVVGNRLIQMQITNIGGGNTIQATRQIQVGP